VEIEEPREELMARTIPMPRLSREEELRQTVELARVLEFAISFSEKHHAGVALSSAGERLREGLLHALRAACDELGPICADVDAIAREIDRLQAIIDERKGARAA
jgi:hypothetical protein